MLPVPLSFSCAIPFPTLHLRTRPSGSNPCSELLRAKGKTSTAAARARDAETGRPGLARFGQDLPSLLHSLFLRAWIELYGG